MNMSRNALLRWKKTLSSSTPCRRRHDDSDSMADLIVSYAMAIDACIRSTSSEAHGRNVAHLQLCGGMLTRKRESTSNLRLLFHCTQLSSFLHKRIPLVTCNVGNKIVFFSAETRHGRHAISHLAHLICLYQSLELREQVPIERVLPRLGAERLYQRLRSLPRVYRGRRAPAAHASHALNPRARLLRPPLRSL